MTTLLFGINKAFLSWQILCENPRGSRSFVNKFYRIFLCRWTEWGNTNSCLHIKKKKILIKMLSLSTQDLLPNQQSVCKKTKYIGTNFMNELQTKRIHIFLWFSLAIFFVWHHRIIRPDLKLLHVLFYLYPCSFILFQNNLIWFHNTLHQHFPLSIYACS